jgi:hypothetical protein
MNLSVQKRWHHYSLSPSEGEGAAGDPSPSAAIILKG